MARSTHLPQWNLLDQDLHSAFLSPHGQGNIPKTLEVVCLGSNRRDSRLDACILHHAASDLQPNGSKLEGL